MSFVFPLGHAFNACPPECCGGLCHYFGCGKGRHAHEPHDVERRIRFKAAWDRRDADPSKNYGVCGVTITFAVIGPAGAVSWELLAGWYLPEVVDWWRDASLLNEHTYRSVAGPIGYHHRTMPAGHACEPVDHCDLLGEACFDGGVAYTDGDLVFERLIREGDAGLWGALEERYSMYVVRDSSGDLRDPVDGPYAEEG